MAEVTPKDREVAKRFMDTLWDYRGDGDVKYAAAIASLLATYREEVYAEAIRKAVEYLDGHGMKGAAEDLRALLTEAPPEPEIDEDDPCAYCPGIGCLTHDPECDDYREMMESARKWLEEAGQ
jgi:hypothetical protein